MEPFASADRVRRLTGSWLEAAGLGPCETPSRRTLVQPGFELRAYGEPGASGRGVLLVPAPIKRSYIWDLAPAASVVRRCLERGLRVYLVRWTDPDVQLGLSGYADGLLVAALRAIQAEMGQRRVVLIGHSLGGTFAALFAAAHPEHVRGLVLLEAPLHFGAGAFEATVAGSRFTRSLGTAPPAVPGTWLGLAATLAAPDVFVGARWIDRVASSWDPERLRLHYRVERWALDELPLSRRLVEDVVHLLYREDRFMRGTLTLGGRVVRPQQVITPILAVVDPRSRVVPEASVRPFLDAAGTGDTTLLEYRGDTGVSLQHVGVLVGPTAHRRLWPSILDWMVRRSASD
jgi:polyhydroxyalkanoate synthase